MLRQAKVANPPSISQASWQRRISLLWLVGMFTLLPIELIKLPLNTSLVDVWTTLALPVIWLSVPRGKQKFNLHYVIPMMLIVGGSIVSTFSAPAPRNGLVVLMKELFAFVWFITATFVFIRLDERSFRRIILVWLGMAFVHGLLIFAQFISPELWRLTATYLGRPAEYDIYRPSGVISNANSAAFFQLLGFVPLFMSRPSRKKGILLALLLLGTMLATGSMGATLALITGCLVALAALLLKGHITVVAGLYARLLVAALLVGSLAMLIVSQNERYQSHLEHIILGRAERSSEGRFDLWERGINVFLERATFFWGVGPENFRVVDVQGKQLHNDLLAFTVERGVIATAGLGMFAVLAVTRAINLFMFSSNRLSTRADLVLVCFLIAMVAAFVYSLTHQVFHNRQLWLILALQEATAHRLKRRNGSFDDQSLSPPKAPVEARAMGMRVVVADSKF